MDKKYTYDLWPHLLAELLWLCAMHDLIDKKTILMIFGGRFEILNYFFNNLSSNSNLIRLIKTW